MNTRGPITEPYYKVLGEGGAAHDGGRGTWPLPTADGPGAWLFVAGTIVPCRRGLHLCVGAHDLIHWLGPVIYTAEARGESIRHVQKTVVREARLLSRCEHWNERTARLFAAACARDVLHIYERDYPNDDRVRQCIEACEKFAHGEVDRVYLDAAQDEAGDATGDAAWAAAWAAWAAPQAAQAASWAAAATAVQAAVGAAARAAKLDPVAAVIGVEAVQAAAQDAVRVKQSRRLAHLLRTGEVVQEFAS